MLEKFLEHFDCKFISIKESHHKWKCPGCIRSIIFRGAEKEIPFAHIKTNFDTMKIDMKDFFKWVEDNC